MDPLRDPLHDSVLDEALTEADAGTAETTAAVAMAMPTGTSAGEADAASDASRDGSILSTLTAALAAADRSPTPERRGLGPFGPPPAVSDHHPLARQYIPGLPPTRPLTMPTGFLGFVHRHRQTAAGASGSSSSARGPPTTPQMPGEPDDPHWQRVMGVNVLNTLQHTGPAFVHAPTLATVKSWSALRIILEEATEMDDICCQRIDPQDLNNPLHLPGPHGTGTGTDNEQEDAEEEQPEGEEEEAAEDESSLDDHHGNDAPDAPDDPAGSTGPSTTGLLTSLADSGSGNSGTAGLDTLDPTDPLNHAGSGTTMAASLPSTVMPDDVIYEVDGVSFNLTAASHGLERHREDQEMLPGDVPEMEMLLRSQWLRMSLPMKGWKDSKAFTSEDGHMLLPQEELHLLEDHYQQRFNAQDPVDRHLHYKDIPRRKAVPNGHPPSASWRLCADLISPWLVTNLQNLWNTSAIKVPRCWTDVDLALVPKPEKSGRSPKDYRPIGLACPLGKKVLGQLVQPHVPGILQHIKRFPQFAYQHQLQQHTRNLHHRYQGHKPVSCALSLKIGTETLLRILTIFADDYHLADAFTSLPAFEHLLDVVAVLFRTLTAFGMEVSAGKSKAILALRGPNVVADIKLAHHPDMLQLITTYGPNFILHTKQPRHHKLQCSVLWQFCLQQYIILRVPPAKMTSPDLQHQEVFGSLATSQAAAFGAALLEGAELDQDLPNLPNKAARVGEGKRQRPRGGNPTYSSFGSHAERGGPGPRNHQAVIKAMGRLLLRQETSIQVLKQKSAWDLYLQPGSQGPLPMLFKASEAYREEAKNKRMDLPLRAQLLSTLFQTVLQCIQAIGTTPAQTKIVQAKGWMNQEGKWVYQRWDSSIQALVVDETRPPMEHQELVGLLGAMAASVRAKDVIHRFNATHQLSADQKGTSRFLLEVGLRAPGVAEVWMGLEKIQNLSALQVVGMQLRRDGLQRCNLAADLQKMLGGY
ncbi:hypothetical protein AK812_SmicGene43221 [Symbiodinium microadriaticum]|uniref:Reverse transcriptase domain-containing protein n=1 Tax=Symbiodinium microadriaticum TaxID=2951 RepID=A0A1Q9C1J8_SYMMI|nr:hypothetical protein AK812_SmicGene43221 [Symbiodinium microadriaticum]